MGFLEVVWVLWIFTDQVPLRNGANLQNFYAMSLGYIQFDGRYHAGMQVDMVKYDNSENSEIVHL